MVNQLTLATALVLTACSAPDSPMTDATEADALGGKARDTATITAPASLPPTPWLVPDTTRWSSYWWTTYRDTTGTLAMRKADLDGDGAVDRAVVVEGSGRGPGGVQGIWVDRASGADTVLVIEGGDAELDSIGFGLLIWSAGDIDHLGSDAEEIPSPFRSEHPVLTVIYFEKSAVTYVWKECRFVPVWTGD
ncbi:MAG: hypothetical protein IPJ76_08600 [Flavobacteriales bacterium]|nr:MAG: hypothetical protein IPJ76_08600 [Flavobacteriales bacterium]